MGLFLPRGNDLPLSGHWGGGQLREILGISKGLTERNEMGGGRNVPR